MGIIRGKMTRAGLVPVRISMVSVHESVELGEASYTSLAVSSDLDGTDGHLESLHGSDDGDL